MKLGSCNPCQVPRCSKEEALAVSGLYALITEKWL